MCGIAGLIDPTETRETRIGAVARMCAAMEHRGPDDTGIGSAGAATLGMRRLAIFDPANGHQPMRSPDGRHTVVFNGAIYNFRELRGELAAGGWSFRTECDTEVLLAALVRWGESALGRLRGMFAFALWDDREQSLLLARDPLGIKPLYYRREGAQLIFASEVNALAASGVAALEIDPAAVANYLAWLAVPAPRTIYRDVFSLRPGERATFRDGKFETKTTWSFATIPTAQACTSRDEFVHELRVRLDDTIRAHVIADVPVGAFLSGGLDSAAVVGLMTRATGTRLKTFSIDFAEAGYSEGNAAAETAAHFGTEHRTTTLTGAEVARDIERLLGALDQPTGDGINTYYASRAARAGGVTVALSGLGGDELFGGYPSFQNVPRLARWLPVWRGVPGAAIRHLRTGDTRRRKLADMLEHARNPHELASLQRQVFSSETRRSLLAPEAWPEAAGASPFHPELPRLTQELRDAGLFELVSAWELRTYMADVLLRDSDVMSMRHSLELRVPFVDRPLLEWLWRQPTALKYDAREPKAVLRAALGDVLPPHLAAGPKRGFALPFALWMKRELRPFLDETFSDASVERSGLFARDAVQSLWRGFVAGNDTREWSRVWSLAVLIAFVNRRGAPMALAQPDGAVVGQSQKGNAQ